jgi:AcrR family transcriptional regulator
MWADTIAVPRPGRAGIDASTNACLRSPPPKGGVGIKQIVGRTRQAGQGHCRFRPEARVQKHCVPLQHPHGISCRHITRNFVEPASAPDAIRCHINILGDGVTDEDASQDWVTAGLAELAKGGVDSVRVEVLADRLGVTKGGFYRRFKDRRALLNAMLETWRDGRVTAIERQAEEGGTTPAERIESLTKLYTERANEQGMAIELAIRQWARNDPMAAAAAAIVDAARLKTASSLYRSLGLSARDADARAVLFYAFLFGQSMMFLDEAPRKRASLIAACARVLMDVEQK